MNVIDPRVPDEVIGIVPQMPPYHFGEIHLHEKRALKFEFPDGTIRYCRAELTHINVTEKGQIEVTLTIDRKTITIG